MGTLVLARREDTVHTHHFPVGNFTVLCVPSTQVIGAIPRCGLFDPLVARTKESLGGALVSCDQLVA